MNENVLDTLYIIAKEVSQLTVDIIELRITAPKWEKTRKRHDWRNYIDDDVQAIWGELPLEARLIAYIQAEKQADEEDWE